MAEDKTKPEGKLTKDCLPEQTRYLCPYQQCSIYRRFGKILRDRPLPEEEILSQTDRAPIVCNNPTDHRFNPTSFFCDAIRVYNEGVNHEGDKLPECSHIRILNRLEMIMFKK